MKGTDDACARDAIVERPPIAGEEHRREPDADGGDRRQRGKRALHRARGLDVAVVFVDDANPGGHLADGLPAQHREDAEVRALHHHQEQRQRHQRDRPPRGERQAGNLEREIDDDDIYRQQDDVVDEGRRDAPNRPTDFKRGGRRGVSGMSDDSPRPAIPCGA